MRSQPTARALLVAAAMAVIAALSAGCATGSSTTRTSARAAQAPVTSRSAVAAPSTASSATTSSPAATVSAKPTPVNHCAHNSAAQLVLVSISRQHAWMCARHRAVYSTGITSGMVSEFTSTPRGNFHIQGRTRNTVLTLNTGAQYAVKYWIPFSGPLFGFHDSSWQRFPYGSQKYRTQGSHGCVHMPLKAMAFLYRWADIGADVHIA